MKAKKAELVSDVQDPRPWRSSKNAANVVNSVTPFRKSMSLRISSSYAKIFSNWISTVMFFLFFLNLTYYAFVFFNNLESTREGISSAANITELTDGASLAEQPVIFFRLEKAYVLKDSSSSLILESFPPVEGNVAIMTLLMSGEIYTGPLKARFVLDQHKLWLAVSSYANTADGTAYLLRYASNVTGPVAQLLLFFGAGTILFSIALGVMRLQGRFITKRVLKRIDELTGKISAISSQNLNLRISVGGAGDELMELAVTFNKMMDRLEHAYGKQSQFVSDASHELRTPISVIQGYARMLERWGKNDKKILDEAIGAISKESHNMQDLVEKLLFLARNDRNSLTIVINSFDLSELVREMCRETELLETGHNITYKAQDGIFIKADRSLIKQALRIIVDNAIKYTPREGSISLALELRDNLAGLSIQDSGVGIDAVELPKVFDRFYRVDSTRDRHTGGHGLGLSIARIIVLRHGGSIKIGSKPGFGTRFTISLPGANKEGK